MIIHLQCVVVSVCGGDVLPGGAVARVVEGADEAARERHQPRRRHRLLVEVT